MPEVIIQAELSGDPRPARELLAVEWKLLQTHSMRRSSWDTLIGLLGKEHKLLAVSTDEQEQFWRGTLLISPDGARKMADWLKKAAS